MLRIGGVLVVSLGACLLLAVACTGDDPILPSAAGVDASTSADASKETPGSPDGGTVCPADRADCAGTGTCDTSLATDPKHCGVCNHDCGPGSACVGEQCQAVRLMENLDGAVSLAVNTTALVVLLNGGPRVCPKSGCSGAEGNALASIETVGGGPHGIHVDEQNAYWLARDGAGTQFELHKCAVAGCGLTPVIIDDAQLGTELRGEGNKLLRYDPTGTISIIYSDASHAKEYLNLVNKPQSSRFAISAGKMAFSCLDGPTTGNRGVWYGDYGNVVPTRLMNEGQLVALHGGTVYASRPVDATYDAVHACAIGGCGGVGAVLGGTGPNAGTGRIADMIADASGVYWVENIGTVGRVMHCGAPDCPGGPKALAVSQAKPVAITTDQSFVYWVNAGTGGANGAVLRVAK